MKFLHSVSFFCILCISFLLLSCAASKTRKELKFQIRQNILAGREAIRFIEKVDSARSAKIERNELDEKSNEFILRYSDSVKKAGLKHMIEDSIILSRRIRHRILDSMTRRVKKIQDDAKNNLGNLSLLDNLLATNTFNQFNTASVFGPGEFIINLLENPSAADPFKRVVDDMLGFAAKFPGKKLNGTFIVLGYADAQQIAAGSALDSTLRVSMGGIDSASSKELNKELSRLRANSVTEVLSNVFVQKTKDNTVYEKLKAEYLPQGRGEQFPNAKIKDYKDDDERRRVVLVYWSILPVF
jgi:hypothetical protein